MLGKLHLQNRSGSCRLTAPFDVLASLRAVNGAPRLPSPLAYLALTPIPTPCIKTDLTDTNCLAQDPAGFTSQVYTIGLGFVGGVALLAILYGAYLILSSQGDPIKLQQGKEYIMYAVIGSLLAVAGFAFYQIIAVDVLKIPGFS